MRTLLKIFKSPWWDLAPVLVFILVAVLEGAGYWIAGLSSIVWLFSIAIRHFVEE